ncbi:MAG: hypothetical protein MUP22_07715 [Desulfobacterales bacterium]|nr:hypothetical protein [Desulfobacterales bacterium]
MKNIIILELKKIDRFLRRLNLTLEYNKEVRRIYKNTSAVMDFNHPSIKEAKKYWRKYNIRLNPKWNAFCASLNNIHGSKYIPENIFFNYVMPLLNNFSLRPAYNNKNYIDNTEAGGVVCGIDKHGNVTEFCYDSKFNKIFAHSFTLKPFKNIALPNFCDLEKIIVQCHERLPHFNLVGWDFGVDEFNEYFEIEHSLLYPGLNYHQVFNGPIFEKYLDEIFI